MELRAGTIELRRKRRRRRNNRIEEEQEEEEERRKRRRRKRRRGGGGGGGEEEEEEDEERRRRRRRRRRRGGSGGGGGGGTIELRRRRRRKYLLIQSKNENFHEFSLEITWMMMHLNGDVVVFTDINPTNILKTKAINPVILSSFCAWAINRGQKTRCRNLQYGPRKRG